MTDWVIQLSCHHVLHEIENSLTFNVVRKIENNDETLKFFKSFFSQEESQKNNCELLKAFVSIKVKEDMKKKEKNARKYVCHNALITSEMTNFRIDEDSEKKSQMFFSPPNSLSPTSPLINEIETKDLICVEIRGILLPSEDNEDKNL
ncbi:CLUMA_CG007448, isoform A [Clunio marinus]|uniref:CLUMA_CG007448, isoform A n=1 Tax=Clunio marinus TaxID=568069 RepID=A0A1J1I698_9DIPT|nr:CLUMA_CG007448, isoform A [Clunio marinus]